MYCPDCFQKKASQPVLYVIGLDNRGTAKDLTRRYSSKWLTLTIKQRVENDWWMETLEPFKGKQTARDREEDDFLDEQILSQPIPKTINE
jgi:hypothetical protein